jgi:hypothetical protein
MAKEMRFDSQERNRLHSFLGWLWGMKLTIHLHLVLRL